MKNRFELFFMFLQKKRGQVIWLILTFFLISEEVFAQKGKGGGGGAGGNGAAGISSAEEAVKSYFEGGTKLILAIGAIVGLIGAVKVYSKWNSGDPDTAKVAAAWFGSCIFLVVVSQVLKSFFL